MKAILGTACAAALAWGCAGAQHPASAPAPNALARDLPISVFAFLAGTWRSQGEPAIEETWTLPLGESLLGMSRTIANGRLSAFEFMRIDRRDGLLTFSAQPNGRAPATPFVLTAFDGRKATFENKGHDFPQRVTYGLEADGVLAASIESATGAQRVDFRYHRVAHVPPSAVSPGP